MKNKYIWIIVGVIILLIVIFIIYKNKNNNNIVSTTTLVPRGVANITPLTGITYVKPMPIDQSSNNQRTLVLLKGKNI